MLLATALGFSSVGGVQADPLTNYDRGSSTGAAPRSEGRIHPTYRREATTGLETGAERSLGCKRTFIERRYNLC